MNNIEKVLDLIDNPDFEEKINAIESEEDFYKFFETQGIILTDDDIIQLHEAITKVLVEEESTLFEEDLDDVSGGCLICDVVESITKKFRITILKRIRKIGIK